MSNRRYNQFFFSPIHKLTGLMGQINVVANVFATITGQGITYTAVARGTAGNGITVTLTSGGTAGAEVVTVVGSAISVQIESGVSTRTQVKTAIDGAAAAAALITVSVVSGGTAATAAAAVTLAGGVDGVVSTTSIKGVASIANTAAGTYTITLQDSFPSLVSAQLTYQAATAVDLVPQVKSVDVVTTKQIVVVLNTGATPTEPSAAGVINVLFLMKNSSVS